MLPPPLHLHPPSFMHPSIPVLSIPAVCDFPHMQSCCPLHCFVFKESDCLSKPREITKPAIISIIVDIMFSPKHGHLSLSLLSLCVSRLLIVIHLSNTPQPTTVNSFFFFFPLLGNCVDIKRNLFNETLTNDLQCNS